MPKAKDQELEELKIGLNEVNVHLMYTIIILI